MTRARASITELSRQTTLHIPYHKTSRDRRAYKGDPELLKRLQDYYIEFLELLEWAGLRVEEGAWAAAAGERKLHGA